MKSFNQDDDDNAACCRVKMPSLKKGRSAKLTRWMSSQKKTWGKIKKAVHNKPFSCNFDLPAAL